MNCEEARQALLDLLAGSISDESRALENHIANCDACRQFAEIQRTLDVRLTAAVPVISLSPGFRSSLRQKLPVHAVSDWPESLPDLAHLIGCALAMVLLLLLVPQYSRTIVLAGAGFTALTYFLQAVLRSYLERMERNA
jgi:hypothetical protein